MPPRTGYLLLLRVLSLSVVTAWLAAPEAHSQTLVGYYNFNQTASPITDQAASPADMATAAGSPGFNQAAIPGQSFGATLSLDGSSYLSTTATKYSALLNDFTVMAWINVADINRLGNSGHSTVIFGTTNQPSPGGWAVGFNGFEQGATVGQPFFVNYGIASYDLGSGSTASLLPTNTWLNLTVTKSSSAGVSFFINGSLVGTVSGATGSASGPATNNWFVGNGADMARQFSGSIDELRVYDGVLSQGQIQSISAIPEPSTYAALCGVAGLGLVAWRRRRVSRA